MSNSLKYQCGDCLERREEENVDMVEHEISSLGKVPICNDSDCSIDGFGRQKEETTQDSEDFKVTKQLE